MKKKHKYTKRQWNKMVAKAWKKEEKGIYTNLKKRY